MSANVMNNDKWKTLACLVPGTALGLLCSATLVFGTAGCRSSGSGQSIDSGNTDVGGPQGAKTDAASDPVSGKSLDQVPVDLPPLDYFVGQCRWPYMNAPVPVDAGMQLHGLTVLATGLPSALALEADANNAYFATATGIFRLPLAGGTPESMVTHAAPVNTAIDGDNLYWSDTSISGQTSILSVPLSVSGWQAFAGDAGATQVATTLASAAGAPHALALANGYLYFGAGSTVLRVATTNGTASTVITGITPTGIAVGTDKIYLGEPSDETIWVVGLAGASAGVVSEYIFSDAQPSGVALSEGDLYWGDWFGSLEHVTLAKAHTANYLRTAGCDSSACEFYVRPYSGGAVWADGDGDCGNIGTARPDGSSYFAVGLSPIGGIATYGSHLYAITTIGELLRWDL